PRPLFSLPPLLRLCPETPGGKRWFDGKGEREPLTDRGNIGVPFNGRSDSSSRIRKLNRYMRCCVDILGVGRVCICMATYPGTLFVHWFTHHLRIKSPPHLGIPHSLPHHREQLADCQPPHSSIVRTYHHLGSSEPIVPIRHTYSHACFGLLVKYLF
ncbi:hypothetical protein F4778DRAFT_714868, partial [Xylariomycetidae sp. FL2044]